MAQSSNKKNQFSDYDKIDLEEELTLSEEVSEIDKKKRNRFLRWFLSRIIMMLLTVLLAISVFSIVSFCWSDIDLQKDVTKSMTDIDGLFFSSTTVQEDTLTKMQTFVANMPKDVRDALNDDWAIVLMNKTPEKLFHTSFIQINDYDTSGMTIGGYTFTQPRTIYVNVNMDQDIIYRSFVHEIGHMISFEHGSIHGSSDWETIYDKCVANEFDTDAYNLSNEVEFFAACFDLYYNEPDKLKKECKEAFDYIESVMKEEIRDDNIFETFLTGCKNTINTLRVYYYYYIVKR